MARAVHNTNLVETKVELTLRLLSLVNVSLTESCTEGVGGTNSSSCLTRLVNVSLTNSGTEGVTSLRAKFISPEEAA